MRNEYEEAFKFVRIAVLATMGVAFGLGVIVGAAFT